jgi:Escherichia/Staphylococcus phage prohead protease
MPREFETRFVKGTELRLSGDDKEPVLSGYIAIFNQLSDDLGGWREKIAPGAFAETIKTQDIRALWNHENDLVLGRNTAGTLELSEDETGLTFKNRPPDTTWFRDRVVSLKRKDVTGSSFGFYKDADEWGTEPDGTRVRTLKKVTLVEVSPGVTFPAYPQASTEVARRSMEAWLAAEAQRAGQPARDLIEMESRNRRLRLQRQVL